jgi:acetyl-CoA acyltransferase
MNSCVRSTGFPGSGRTPSPLAHTSWQRRRGAAGFYDDLVMPVPGTELVRDETISSGSTPETLATLKPVLRPDGTITAGNASPLNDGASAVLLGS